jgi:hypothetical protein
MATKRTMSDLQLLENCRIAIDNLQKETDFAAKMAEFGYDKDAVQVGKVLYDKARTSYDDHIRHKDLLKKKVYDFKEAKSRLQALYGLDRKKAKLVFKNDPMAQTQLMITGKIPRNFIPWLEMVRTFYNMLSENSDLAHPLLRLKVTPEEIQEGHLQIKTIEETRAAYFQSKAEYQLSTIQKEAALNALHQWNSILQATVKIAYL